MAVMALTLGIGLAGTGVTAGGASAATADPPAPAAQNCAITTVSHQVMADWWW